MYGSKRVAVRDLNPHILCALCGGYLIQATTVIECLHSFCRSCIVNFLETSKVCPICDAQIHKTRPLLNIRPDQTLQSLVYKLVPGLFQDEMRRRREFHATLSESDLEDLTLEEKGEASLEREFKPGDDHVSLILQMAFRKNDKKGFKVRDTRYLLCPSEVTIKHLKRFVRCKFQLGENFKIEMFRAGEELTDDLMLQDIALIYSWRGDKPMHICYTVQERASGGSSKDKIKLEQPAQKTCREMHKPEPAVMDPIRKPVSPLTTKARSKTAACSTAPPTATSSYTSAPPSTTPLTVTCHTPGAFLNSATPQRLQTAKCSSSSSNPYLISATTKTSVLSPSVASIVSPTATSVTCPKTSSVSCPTASSDKASRVKPLICSLGSDPGLTQPEIKKECKSSVTSQVGQAMTITPSDSPPTLSASWESETAASSVSRLLHSVQSILSKGTKKTIPVVNTLSWTPVCEPQTKQPVDTKLGADKIDRKVTATLERRETFQPDNHESLKTEASSQVFIKKEADDSSQCEKLASLKSEKCLSLKTESAKQHECDTSINDAQESLKSESSGRESSKHRRRHKSAKRDKRDKTKHESRKSSSKRDRKSKHETGASECSTQSDNNNCAREKRVTSKSKKRKSSKCSKRESRSNDSSKSELLKTQPSVSVGESLTINRSSDVPSCDDNNYSKREGVAGVQRSQSVLEKPTWPSAVGSASEGLPAAAAATIEKHQAKDSSFTEDTSEDYFDYIPKFQKHRKIMPLTRSISCEGQVTNLSPVSVSNSDAMEKRNWKKRKLSTMDLSSSSVGSSSLSGDYTLGSVACCDKTCGISPLIKVEYVHHTVCGVTSVHSSANVQQPLSEKVPHQSTSSSVYQSSVPDRLTASSSSFSCLPFVPPQNGIFTSSFTKQQGKEECNAILKTSPRHPTPKINFSNNNEVTCGSKNGGGGNDPSTVVAGKIRTAPPRSIKSTSRGNPSVASATNGDKPSKHASRPKVTEEKSSAVMRSSNIHKSLEEICVEISSSPSDVSSVTSPATDVTSPGTEDRADTSALPEIQSPCDTGCVVHFHGRVGPLDLSSKKKK